MEHGDGSSFVNSVSGTVSGVSVQAQRIDGGVHVTVGAGTRVEVMKPHRCGVVPLRAECFQDRAAGPTVEDESAAGEPASTRVLSGLGGVGKTQLAADHAERMWASGELDLLVWVSAGSREAIVSAYASAAIECAWHAGDNPEEGARRFLARLAATPERWLVVLDDVQSPGDAQGLWPPHTATGHVIVTTRRRDAALSGHRRQVVDVGVFTPAESMTYLTAKLGLPPGQAPQAAGLAEELGHLPLALAQAAAYMVDEGLDCAAYRARLTDRRRTLAEVLPEPGLLPDDHRDTVAATWSLSIEAADRIRPAGLARHVLAIAAVLDSNGIPAAIFTSPAVIAHLSRVVGAKIDGDAVRSALRCLHRLTLITADPSQPNRAVRIHALVQRAAREQLPPDDLAAVAHAGADALHQMWPDVDAGTDLAAVLRANADVLRTSTNDFVWNLDHAHPVLLRAGRSLGESGLVTLAVSYFRELHALAAYHLGPEHPDTLAVRNNLALWQGEAGDPAGAATALEHLLTDALRLLGPDHPSTLTVRGNLARWRGQAGDPAGAVAALEHLLADRLRVLGPDHPDTLGARNNLALWRGESGDAAGAASAFEQLLADRLRVMGPNHPDTLITRANLARWRGQAGDPVGAASAFWHLLTDQLRVLGPDHPDTLLTRHYFAHWRGKAGDPAGATAALEQLVTDAVRVLGADNPLTLSIRDNHAYWVGVAGDPAGAVKAYEPLVADILRVLGPDHPNTLVTRGNFARWLGHAGDPAGAAAAFEQLLSDTLRLLGPDHPTTRFARDSLAAWQHVLASP